MKLDEIEIEEKLSKSLEAIRRVPGLDAQIANEERLKFLELGEEYRKAVSVSGKPRLINWIDQWIQSIRRKELKPMMYAILTFLISFTLLFGGAGASVAAAQDDLPGDALYGLKIWSEQVRTRWMVSDQEQFQWMLKLTNRRMAEVEALLALEKPIPETVALQLHQHQETALQLAAGLEDEQMVQALMRVRQQAENQLRTLQDWMAKGSGNEDPILLRIRDRLQEQLHLCDEGVTEPDTLRIRLRDRDQDRTNWPFGDPQASPGANDQPGAGGSEGQNGEGYGPGPDAQGPDEDPGSFGPGPQAGTATPQQNGPGPNQPTATPQQGEPGPKQPTATPQQSDPDPKQPTTPPRQGSSGPGQPSATPAKGSSKP
jgi:hypothetical protein